MRIISFMEMWPKLSQDTFTTWRMPRRDADWRVGEKLQVWYRQRSPKRKFLFNAEVVSKTSRWLLDANGMYITTAEAEADGFETPKQMLDFLRKAHGPRVSREKINILTLRKINEHSA